MPSADKPQEWEQRQARLLLRRARQAPRGRVVEDRSANPGDSAEHLAAGIAHEFNNLLTIVLGNATALRVRAEAQGDAQAARRAAQIELAAERGARLTGQLLAYARQEMLQPEEVRLESLIADLQLLIVRAAGEGVQVRISSTQPLWPCRIDPVQFESALLNLVLNARDAMPDGGTISIHLSSQPVDAPSASGPEPGDYVRVEVTDSGTGMSPAVRKRAFEPFFTTKPIGKGAGLGLAQVQGFVRQSGGFVELHTEPGLGTTIALAFPRAREAADLASPAAGRQTILVAANTPAIPELLSGAGHHVITAANAAAALDALGDAEPPDMLIADVRLPDGSSALALAQEAQVIAPELKVLLIAGSAEELDPGTTAIEFALLPRPYQPDELLRVVDALMCERLIPRDVETMFGSARERHHFDRPAYVTSRRPSYPANTAETIRMGIMPIRALAGTPEAELAPGLAEEITNALSRFRWVSCVAPTSVAAVSADKLGQSDRWRKLDLDFVLEGTLQRDQQRLRLTVRLIDLRGNAEVVWGRRFDGLLTDLVDLQARIAAETVAQVAPEVLLWAGDRLAARPAGDPNAYQLTLRAIPAIYRLDRAGFETAGRLLADAVRLDPENASAHAWLAHWHLLRIGQGWSEAMPAEAESALFHAERAVTLDPDDARGLTTAGHVRAFLRREAEAGLALHARALAVNPNLPIAWCYKGLANSYLGQHAEAIASIEKAQSLAPFDPHRFFFEMSLIMPHLLTGRYETAARCGRRALAMHPGLSSTLKGLLSALGHLGQKRQARVILRRLLALEPGFTVRSAVARSPLRLKQDLECYADGLRRAGLSES